MKTVLATLAFLSMFTASAAYGYAIQYIGNGTGGPQVKITWSRSNGAKWETRMLKPGQTFQIPKDTTNLKIDNVNYQPNRNYKIRDGNVS